MEVDLKLNDAVQLIDFVIYDNKADDYDYYHDLLKDLCDLIHDTLPKLDSVKLLDLLVTLNGFKNAIVHSVLEEIVERLGRAKYLKTIGDYMLKTKGFQAIKLGSNYVEEERISEHNIYMTDVKILTVKLSETQQERLFDRCSSEIMGTKCCQLLGKSSRQLFPSNKLLRMILLIYACVFV